MGEKFMRKYTDVFTQNFDEEAGADTVTVGTTNITISPPDKQRCVIYFRNSSSSATAEITIALGQFPAVANKGIVLTKGKDIVESDSESFRCWRGTINVIANEAATTLTYYFRHKPAV